MIHVLPSVVYDWSFYFKNIYWGEREKINVILQDIFSVNGHKFDAILFVSLSSTADLS